MKQKIIAKDWDDLVSLIEEELKTNGNQCDLNHIDVSNIISMDRLFEDLIFNGDISQWDTSKVESMEGMFLNSFFNGDISNWNTSKVENMYAMFKKSKFNRDISKWNVEKVIDMGEIFLDSDFSYDLNIWKPFQLELLENPFKDSYVNIPYWAKIESKEERKKAIDSYWLKKELSKELDENRISEKKLKI